MNTFNKYKVLARIVGATSLDYKNVNTMNFNILVNNGTSRTLDNTIITKERLLLANEMWNDIKELYNTNRLELIFEGYPEQRVLDLINALKK